MSQRVVHVSAPSRLHFGLFSLGRTPGRQFGGVGAMISAPRLELTARPSGKLEALGPRAERALETARQAISSYPPGQPIPVRLEITSAPRPHVGLGSGTQLAMAIAAALRALFGGGDLTATELAGQVGRGRRSAVGLYGFAHGGLILEGGKTSAEVVSPLVSRVRIPESWRFVLVCPTQEKGLSGSAEQRAFAGLPPVPGERSERLLRKAEEELLPAAAAGQFDDFSEALFHVGYTAGLSFAHKQGGPFASGRLTALVERIRDQGIRGVGQSSWGPTLFVARPDRQAAAEFVELLGRLVDCRNLEMTIAAPDNRGALVKVTEDRCGSRLDTTGRETGESSVGRHQ